MGEKNQYQEEKFLIQELRKGNLNAFQFIFDRDFSELCNYCNVYLHDSSLSEEVVLDIYTRIWENRCNLEIRSTLKGYLYISVRNKAISTMRKEKRQLFDPFKVNFDELSVDLTSQFYLENKELREIISAAVASLPDKTREVYVMAREELLSHKEISEKLGISPKTVENHVGIALRKLREYLRPYARYFYLLVLFCCIVAGC